MKYKKGEPVIFNGEIWLYKAIVVEDRHWIEKLNGSENRHVYGNLIKKATEDKYFNEVMKPEGWNITTDEKCFANSQTEMYIRRDKGYAVQPEYIHLFTRYIVNTITRALDHSEALQAIKKFEQS